MMKKLLAASALLLAIPALACTGFLESEVESGMNRICYYEHLGDTVAYNVPVHRICPVTVKVPHDSDWSID